MNKICPKSLSGRHQFKQRFDQPGEGVYTCGFCGIIDDVGVTENQEVVVKQIIENYVLIKNHDVNGCNICEAMYDHLTKLSV